MEKQRKDEQEREMLLKAAKVQTPGRPHQEVATAALLTRSRFLKGGRIKSRCFHYRVAPDKKIQNRPG